MSPNGFTAIEYRQIYDKGHAETTARMLQQLGKGTQMVEGTKPVVICGGAVTEAKDMDEAQRIAEREAHAKSTDAYILKPVRRVAPKREVVTVEL